MEHDFFVEVRGDVFPIKLCVEFRGDGRYGFVFLEDEGEGDRLVALFCALFGEGFGAHNLRGGIGGVPGAEEDVVFGIEGGNVFDFAELVYFVLHVVCEGDGAKDGEGPGLETHNRAASSDLYLAKAPEWHR